MNETAPQPPDPDLAAVIGPARLAYFTPVHEQPTLADRKAMFILAASGLIATVLLFFAHPFEAMVRSVGGVAGAALVALLLCVAALILVAAMTAYTAYRRPLPPMPPTLAFFRDVAASPLEAYAAAVRTLDHRRAVRDMLHYNYSVATQAARKFRLVNRALSCLRLAIPLWMLLLLVLAVWG
jgi:pycsar effector protein